MTRETSEKLRPRNSSLPMGWSPWVSTTCCGPNKLAMCFPQTYRTQWMLLSTFAKTLCNWASTLKKLVLLVSQLELTLPAWWPWPRSLTTVVTRVSPPTWKCWLTRTATWISSNIATTRKSSASQESRTPKSTKATHHSTMCTISLHPHSLFIQTETPLYLWIRVKSSTKL